MPVGAPGLFFHPVVINDYGLFKYPDYTLPLSVKMAEVSRDHQLDILHVHYAVPHATAAILARSMLADERQPRVVTTLHGTDTTLLGADPGYGPAIHHALTHSDAVTTVSEYLRGETQRVLGFKGPMDVIYNFCQPRPAKRSREQTRRELGVGDEALIVHASNLRPVKRIDLLLETAARIRPRESFKLLILAGGTFAPFAKDARCLGVEDRLIVRENILDVEDYLEAADLGLQTSESESFCLSVLEAMFFGKPSVATRVGGIPEVMRAEESGILVPFGDPEQLARAAERLIQDPKLRATLGSAAQARAKKEFSAEVIVAKYEGLYRRVLSEPAA
jgi:N-acetyl-alpha-D-glucosaminyl L-malate synthase BshA